MRALLCQLAPAPGDTEANVEVIARSVRSRPEADIAVFPELFVSGYRPRSLEEAALAPGDPVLEPLLAAAEERGTAIVFGFAERCEAGVANSVGFVGSDGEWRGSYRKTHLFGEWERTSFIAGDALRVTELCGRRIGVLICFDLEFPEPARALAQAGASLLVTCSANMEPYGADHALAMRARALDNRLPHIYVNRAGQEAGLRFTGGSAVIDPDGSLITSLGAAPEIRCVDVPRPAASPADVDYLALLRRDLEVEDVAAPPIAQGGVR